MYVLMYQHLPLLMHDACMRLCTRDGQDTVEIGSAARPS